MVLKKNQKWMKNKIILSEWYGFFGNNLEQIAGAILFAKCSDGETQLVFPNYKPTLAPKVSLPGSGLSLIHI